MPAPPFPALARPRGTILYVLQHPPAPSERFVAREIAALREHGVALELATWAGGDGEHVRPSRAPLLRALVRPHAFTAALRATARGRAVLSREEKRGWLAAARAAARALAAAHAWRADPPSLVHAHFASEPATVAMLLASELRRPWGFSVHAHDLWAEGRDLTAKVESAAYVLCCSEAASDALRARLPTRLRARVHTVHHGIDLRRWRPERAQGAERARRILFAGRFEPKKGLPVLLRACALLAARGEPFECDVVGEGRARREIAASVRALGLDARVRLLGWLPGTELRALYARATLLAVPSITAPDGDRDNLPNVIVEALACGLPVVASALPSLTRLSGATDCLRCVPPGDAEALAAAFVEVWSDPLGAGLRAERGVQLAARAFDAARNAARIAEIFQRAEARAPGDSLACASAACAQAAALH